MAEVALYTYNPADQRDIYMITRSGLSQDRRYVLLEGSNSNFRDVLPGSAFLM